MSKESNKNDAKLINPFTIDMSKESNKKDTIKYSEINDWVINFMENCSAESIVDILTWALDALGEISKMLSPVMPEKMADLKDWLYDGAGRIDPSPGKQLFPRMKLIQR